MRSAVLFFTLVSAGCSVTGRVEAEVEAALPRALGPADRYDATVEGLSLRAGTADRVDIVGERVRREGAPVVDRLDAVLWGVAFDRSERRLTRVDSTRATARIRPDDLAAYLGTLRGIDEATVSLAPPDRMTVRVRGEVAGLRLPGVVEVVGRLAASDGRLRFDIERVRAAGVSLGGTIARAVADEVNPVLDLTDDDPALRVEGARVQDGAAVVRATGDLSGLRLGP